MYSTYLRWLQIEGGGEMKEWGLGGRRRLRNKRGVGWGEEEEKEKKEEKEETEDKEGWGKQ